MNGKVNLDLYAFKTLYKDYKPFVMPLAVIVACVCLFLAILLPQILQFINSQGTTQIELQKLKSLNNSLFTLQNLSDSTLTTQMNTLTSALPEEKAYASIINAVNYCANSSGVILGDFNFQVGNLKKVAVVGSAVPTIEMTLNLTGSIKETTTFLKNLYSTVPLSAVESVNLTPEGSIIKVVFYYKTLSPFVLNDQSLAGIEPISQDALSLISKLDGFNVPSAAELFPIAPVAEVASTSAF